MEFEGSIGFVSRKKKKNIADFHVLGLFMAKKHVWAKKIFRLPRAVAVERKICDTPTASPLQARKLKFRLPESFRPTWCPAYSEF
jgi:hypothetical protein